MKVLLGLVSVSLFYAPVFGQSNLSLSLSAAPHYDFSSIKRTDYFPDSKSGVAIPVDWTSRQTGQGYSVGLMAHYAFPPRWSLSTGLWLNHTYYKAPVITTNPAVLISSGATRQRNYQIPLLVNYQSATRRLSPYFSAGTLFSFPAITFFSGSDNPGKFGNRRVRVVPAVAAGLHYRLNAHLSLSAQPMLSYYLPNSKEITYYNSYRLSVQTQLVYKL